MKTIKQTIVFDATPKELYNIFLSSKLHTRMIGAPAKISKKVGGSFSIWGGEISGKNIKLVKDKKIVQKWRAKNWPENHYSTATFEFIEEGKKTKLIFTQKEVPDKECKGIEKGWKDYYWKPLNKMLKDMKE